MKRNKNSGFSGLIMFMWMLLASVQFSYSFPNDSLKIKWHDGKKYQLHKVVAKDTWTSVSKKYNISVEELEKANAGVSVLKIGQIIEIPAAISSLKSEVIKETTPVSSPKTKASAEVKPVKQNPTAAPKNRYHVVAKGETLYRIAKESGITVDELKQFNNLTSNNVSVGQSLIVGKSPTLELVKENKDVEVIKSVPIEKKEEPKKVEPEVKSPATETTTIIKQETDKPAKVDSPSVYSTLGNSKSSSFEKDDKTGATVEKITESGVATWMTDGELNQNKFYAMHRTAPVGTIIKLTNKMNNNSVFVKVVGLLPDTGDNANTIIKITQAAAQRIGALDQRFQAELTYGIPK